ncbi:MAG: hypothetical protein ACREDT_13220, partial [Methylocella sp.]
QRGQDGIFYEVETGTPIARDVGGSIVFDAATLESVAAPKETSRTSDRTASAASAEAEAEKPQPNVCPEPGPDVPHGDSERARLYQAQISALNNPQRPLPPGLAVTLNGVAFDDCRERDGTMIEAKGPGFAHMLERDFMYERISARWVKQATDQVDASGGRAIEWYFAETDAADKARDIFNEDTKLRRILIFTVPTAEAP